MKRLVLALGVLVSLLAGRAAADAAPAADLPDGLYARFDSPRGAFVCELFAAQAPLTVTSFVGLAEGTLAPRGGKPFFTGLKWYRVVPDFVVQSGNPGLEDTGDTPVPYSFPDEFAPGLHHGSAGVLSMANAGPDTNGCEFFVTLRDTTRLNYLHAVFGRVVRGLDVLPRIKAGDPFAISIVRVGAAARAFRADQPAFDARLAQAKRYAGPAAPGPDAAFDDPDKLLPLDPPRAANFNFKLANFERATGVKIVARVFAHSPPEAEDAQPGAYMRALAAKLGTLPRGVLTVYFADEHDWRLWIGDDRVADFLGRAAVPEDLVEDGALHRAKTAFLEAAAAQAAVYTAEAEKAAPAGQPVTAAQKTKYSVDAVLDALLLKFEPK